MNSNIGSIISRIVNFFTPVVMVSSGLVGIISFLLGALANPEGLLNSIVVSVIDIIAVVWPSTPDNLKIGTLLTSAVDTFPAFGTDILVDIFESVVAVLALVSVVKIYKLIPFKGT